MKYVYSAIFTPSDGGYDVYFPDLFGCRTCADTLAKAIEMAEDAAETWLWASEKDETPIPVPSEHIDCTPPQFVTYIKADADAYRRQMDTHAGKEYKSKVILPENKNRRLGNFNKFYLFTAVVGDDPVLGNSLESYS